MNAWIEQRRSKFIIWLDISRVDAVRQRAMVGCWWDQAERVTKKIVTPDQPVAGAGESAIEGEARVAVRVAQSRDWVVASAGWCVRTVKPPNLLLHTSVASTLELSMG